MPITTGCLHEQVLGFVDLGGHARYLKTALYGMTCMLPDYVLLCHNATASALSKVFREHLAAALALRIPVAMVLTKVRSCSATQFFLLEAYALAMSGSMLHVPASSLVGGTSRYMLSPVDRVPSSMPLQVFLSLA